MFYFRKIWIISELFLLMLWTICKYIGSYFIKFIINSLWSASASGKLPLNPTNLIAKMQSLNVSLAVLESKVLYIIILIALLVLLWLVIDLFSGQLVRDVKLVPIIKFLVRDVNQDSLNVVMVEENKANKWIRRSRIIKWKKKLVFIMPIALKKGRACEMGYRETKMSKYFIKKAEKVRVTRIRYTENYIEREHTMARISLITGVLYLFGGSLSQAKRQLGMWRYLRSKKD